MAAAGGDYAAAAPSKALMDVRRCIAEVVAASAEEAPAQPTHDAAQSLAAVAAGDFSGLVLALQRWHDDDWDFAPLEDSSQDYLQVAVLKPRFELGDATLDVLLHFFEMRDTIRRLWRGKKPAASGTLLPLLFQFFGFYWGDFVTSRKQLYRRALDLKKELKELHLRDGLVGCEAPALRLL
jgi:hypothetical protein